MHFRGFIKFGIKVLWRLQVPEYLRTLHLKFQKAQTKIEVVLSLPCWLSQSWGFDRGNYSRGDGNGRFDFLILTWSWSPWFSIVNPDLQIKKTWSWNLDFLIFTLFIKLNPDLQEDLIFKKTWSSNIDSLN